jgi:signal transduction histidine kinase
MNELAAREWADDAPHLADHPGVHRRSPPSESITPALESTETVLKLLAGTLLRYPHCLDAGVFEYRRLPGGQPIIGRLACAPGGELPPEIVTAVLSETFSGAAESFKIGRGTWAGQTGFLFGLRFADQAGIPTGGYALFSTEPDSRLEQALNNIWLLGSKLLASVRKVHARRQSETLGQDFQTRMSEALQIAADAYWEADNTGQIRHVVWLKHGLGQNLLQNFEGRNLAAILRSSTEQDRIQEFRNQRLELRNTGGQSQILEISGRSMTDGTWQGIARCVGTNGSGGPTVQQARSLIDKLEAARDHEAVLRRETELILDGLRILTSGAASRELFQKLLELLMPALEFHDAVILHRDWLNRIGVSATTSARLHDLDWQAAGARVFALDEIASILELPKDLALPKSEPAAQAYGSALAVRLNGGAKPTVLLCLHRAPGFFGKRHLGLAIRLSLIAGQALMTEEERQKVIDASKLATIGEMAAGIVHEINQPLTVITLALNNLGELLQSGREIEREKISSKVSKLKDQVTRVSKIVGNMRVLARHSDGTNGPFRIEEPVREAIGIIEHKFSLAKIEIEIGIDESLCALGNALEFSQVIINLLSNAHDAILSKNEDASKEKTRRVALYAQYADAEWIELTVRDTGSGFPAQETDRAFQPFFTTKEPGKGTGLGLALCRRIIEGMGGTISLGNWSAGAEIRLRIKRAEG